MNDTLIGAMSTLFTLQKWNFLPRVETWVEAENVAYVTHIGYAVGQELRLTKPALQSFLLRSILKSFNKHFLSDIPVRTRDELKKYDISIWKSLLVEAANYTSQLFPRKIVADVRNFLEGKEYANSDQVEILVNYAQQMAAREECETNKKVYNIHDYDVIMTSIEKKIEEQYRAGQDNGIKFIENGKAGDIFKTYTRYFQKIKILKYLRRWNRVNRSVESSVMSHTFIVAFLALLFSKMSEKEISEHTADGEEKSSFLYRAILRALFHDVPESLTGDIITPVKHEITKVDKDDLKNVEGALKNEIVESAPLGVKREIEDYHLLEEINKNEPHSVSSLVKDCDMLALVLECLLEKLSGRLVGEMLPAYSKYLNDLQNSEWSHVREFCTRVSVELPPI